MNGPAWDNKELCRVGIRNFAISTMLYKWCVIRFTVKYKSKLRIPESPAYIYHFSTFGWSCYGELLIHAPNSALMILPSFFFFFFYCFFLRYSASFIERSPLVYLRPAVWCKFHSYPPCSCVTAEAAAL